MFLQIPAVPSQGCVVQPGMISQGRRSTGVFVQSKVLVYNDTSHQHFTRIEADTMFA